MLNYPNKIFIFFIIVFVFIGISINAQTLFSNEKNITVYDGLSNNQITVIFQDSRGYIWFGTEDGLNRYDGYRMVVFRHEPLDSTSISGNLIQSINETPDGRIWVGTRNNGLNVWDRNKDSFIRYINNPNDPFSLPENEVCGIMITKYGRVWIKTRIFLSLFDPEKKTFSSYGHYTNIFKPGRHFKYPLIEGSSGIIWVGTKDGLNKFDLNDRIFSRQLDVVQNLDIGQDMITDMIHFNDSLLLVSTPLNVKFFNSKDCTYTSISDIVNVKNTNVLHKGKDGKIWLGTKDGLSVLYRDELDLLNNNQLKYISTDIIDDEVTSIMEDRSRILWVGTKHKGVYVFNQNPSKFLSISRKDQSVALNSYNITSLLLDDDNRLWLGTSDDGVYIINRKTGESEHFSLLTDDLKGAFIDDAVFSIYADNDSTIWFGTNHGVFQYNSQINKIEEFDYCGNKEFETLLKDNVIRTIAEDDLNNLWFGTKFGLYKYNRSSIESFFCDAKDSLSLCDDDVYSLINDKDGWLWIGTKKGINIYKPSEGYFTRLKNSSLDPFLLSNDYVLSIADDLNGNIWIGTRTGLTFFDKKTQKTKNYLKKDGLDNDVINGVLTDKLGRVWVSTNKGISLIGVNGSILNFSIDDGLAGYVFNSGATYKSKEGELFFGGFDGVSYLYPGLIELNLEQPNVIVSSITVYNKGEVVESWTGEVNEISYKYQKNSSINIEYSGLEYTQSSKNRYQVFLEGFDDNWRPVTYKTNIVFSNLPPGNYKLLIKGSNNDYVWNNKPCEIKIEINPPLWQSNYAYAFYIIAFIFLLQAVINFRIRYYRKAYQSLKEKAVDKKKIEAQKEALFKINKSLTDSINYAKRIQEGMLPSDHLVKSFISESFIYFRPKDIVSGDFYYMYKKYNKLFVAAVDCTGHGVPGAFMSIIGNDLFRNTIEIQGIEHPDEILNSINRQLLEIFKKDILGTKGAQYEVNDGMDLSLVVIDFDNKLIEFAGANNDLYLVRDNEIVSYVGDRYPVGYNDPRDLFTKQDISFKPNDIIYLFSDGYVDQFGGPEGKKFKYRRFRHLILNIHKLPFEDQKAILHQKMEEWMGDQHEQIDDILLIGLKL